MARAFCSNDSTYIHVADHGEQSGTHSSTMNLKVELTNKLKIGTFQAQLQQSDDVLRPLSNGIILARYAMGTPSASAEVNKTSVEIESSY